MESSSRVSSRAMVALNVFEMYLPVHLFDLVECDSCCVCHTYSYRC
jgi:hypothetical protein